jgi:hypothetical protein
MFHRGTPNLALWIAGVWVVSVAAQAPGRLPALRSFESRHYDIRTDLDEEFAQDLTRRLDAMYDEYLRRFTEFAPPPGSPKLSAYLIARRADYLRVTDARLGNSAGVFIPDRNLLAAYLQDQGREQVRSVLQHEAFHQFAHTAISPDLPIWLNEGIAELFEAGIWTGDAFIINQVPPYRVRQLVEDLQAGRLEPFSRLFQITHEQWLGAIRKDPERAGVLYNQSWAVIHWLINADDDPRVTGGRRIANRDRLVTYLKSRRDGVAHAQAWEQAFPQSPQAMQRKFEAWARQLQPTPEAALIERQQVLGDMLISFHSAGQSPATVADFQRLAGRSNIRLTYTRGSVRWTTDEDATRYFQNLAGRYWSDRELRFERPKPVRGSSTAVLPDIVLAVRRDLVIRTSFYMLDGELRSETQIQSVR